MFAEAPPSLSDGFVLLKPLHPDLAEALAAAAGDRSTFCYTWVPDGVTEAREYVRLALEQAQSEGSWPYAVALASSGRIVGSTRVFDLVRFGGADEPGAGEIGSTWYAAEFQRTGVNTAVKRLLLTELFEVAAFERVTLKTDARNERSRDAIARLGAHFEGVRRAHMTATDGGIRDTAYYSIIRSEWPAVRDRLGLLAAR